MSMTVKVTTLPVTAKLAAAIRTGMVEAASPILAAAAAGAPEEPEPRHGIHLNETGFVRYAQPAPDVEAVAVGFTAFWARWQEINDQYQHPHGHAHFLEMALLEGAQAWLAEVGDVIRKSLG